MLRRQLIVSLALFVVLPLAAVVVRAADKDIHQLLQNDEVTLQNVRGFFNSAFIPASFDEDGDLLINDDGMKTFVRVDPEKKVLTFFTAWHLREDVSNEKKLEFVNELNDQLLLVRFSLTNPTMLWCDYQIDYEGQITPYFIVNTYRTYAKVIKGVVTTMDPDDIIGD